MPPVGRRITLLLIVVDALEAAGAHRLADRIDAYRVRTTPRQPIAGCAVVYGDEATLPGAEFRLDA